MISQQRVYEKNRVEISLDVSTGINAGQASCRNEISRSRIVV